MKRDPAHNTLGDEPPEVDDDPRSRNASHTPFDDNSRFTSAEPLSNDTKPAALPLPSIPDTSQGAPVQSLPLDLPVPSVEVTEVEDLPHVKDESDLANALPLTYNSKGWEDLTVEEKA